MTYHTHNSLGPTICFIRQAMLPAFSGCLRGRPANQTMGFLKMTMRTSASLYAPDLCIRPQTERSIPQESTWRLLFV